MGTKCKVEKGLELLLQHLPIWAIDVYKRVVTLILPLINRSLSGRHSLSMRSRANEKSRTTNHARRSNEARDKIRKEKKRMQRPVDAKLGASCKARIIIY